MEESDPKIALAASLASPSEVAKVQAKMDTWLETQMIDIGESYKQ